MTVTVKESCVINKCCGLWSISQIMFRILKNREIIVWNPQKLSAIGKIQENVWRIIHNCKDLCKTCEEL